MNLLVDYHINELKEMFVEAGIKGFRAAQVFQWINRGVDNFSEMSDLPKDLREELQHTFKIGLPKIKSCMISKKDGTRKYILEMEDGQTIESVLMRYNHGISVCISSQIGCRMGCLFCASTGINFIRQLSAGEMLGQVIAMQKDIGERISNVVVMGIGEPLDNYDNIVKFLRLVNDEKGLNIGMRHISVSTCGLIDKMLELADEGFQITLSVSLHAPNDAIRNQIMPVNKSNSIDNLLHGCKIYSEKTKRRITMEYAMIHGLNDTVECARQLGKRLKGMMCHVNLIPVNEIKGTPYKKSTKEAIDLFCQTLEQWGIEVTVRREMGADIAAACGQLRRNSLKSNELEKLDDLFV